MEDCCERALRDLTPLELKELLRFTDEWVSELMRFVDAPSAVAYVQPARKLVLQACRDACDALSCAPRCAPFTHSTGQGPGDDLGVRASGSVARFVCGSPHNAEPRSKSRDGEHVLPHVHELSLPLVVHAIADGADVLNGSPDVDPAHVEATEDVGLRDDSIPVISAAPLAQILTSAFPEARAPGSASCAGAPARHGPFANAPSADLPITRRAPAVER